MKTALVLVGHHEVTEERYQPIVEEFHNNGWKRVILYKSNWQTANVEQLIRDFVDHLSGDHVPLTLLGFSLGAMIALIAASRVPVENLILCSPSGYFVEYSSLLSKDDREWVNENLKDFQNFSAADVLNKLSVTRGVIITGQTELKQWLDFRKWIHDLKTQTGWQYIELPQTGHEIEASPYQEAIKKTIHSIA